MPTPSLDRYLLLPELQLVRTIRPRDRRLELHAIKVSEMEVCPKCATPSKSIYDHRTVTLKDDPVRGENAVLIVTKRRFYCRPCKKPFTEPLQGVRKGYRTTERYRQRLLWLSERFSDLSRIRKDFRCSAGLLYRILYERLELNLRKRQYAWPEKIGIDEHFFKRQKGFDARRFVTMVTDHSNRRLFEVVDGRASAELSAALDYIPGRDNVRFVTLDMSDTYRKFVRDFFPNATLVADKFHVLRLIVPALNRYRKAVTGDRRSLYVRLLLLRNERSLQPWWRTRLRQWLDRHPDLRELWELKEALQRFYRIRGPGRARRALVALTDVMAKSLLPEVQTLRRTLLRWRNEVLAYFRCRLTNARTEGFNAKAKLVKRRGYGYKSFRNYRLRLLNACM